jgi:hypothetical protein
MEANNIIAQIQSLKKQIGESQFTAIEIDLVKKQLLECYELLFSGMAAKPSVQEEPATNFEVPVKQETPIIIAEKEEINPFVAVIEEEVKQRSYSTSQSRAPKQVQKKRRRCFQCPYCKKRRKRKVLMNTSKMMEDL